MRHRCLRQLLALPLLLIGYAAVSAQGIQSPAAGAPTGPEVIATSEIPTRADVDANFAQGVLERSQNQNPFAALEPELNDLANSVGEQGQLLKSFEIRLLPIIRLESFDRHWRFFARQFETWRASLEQTSNQYLEDAAMLGRRKADWQATYSAAQAAGVPAALLERITTVQSQLAQAEQAVSAPLTKLLQLRARANIVAMNIETGRKTVVTAIAYSDSRLGEIDAPPIWSVRNEISADSAGAANAGLKFEARFLNEYARADRLLFRPYLIFELALLPLLIWLSRRVRSINAEDPETRASVRVLRRPFSLWLLIVTTSVLLIERDAPILLNQIVLLTALIPVLRCLPLRIFEMIGSWPYALSGIILLKLCSFLFLSNAFYYRWYLLFVALLTIGLLVRRVLQTRTFIARNAFGAELGAVAKVMGSAVWVAFVLLLVSAIANVFGNVSLSNMLTDALLISAYIGLILHACVHVITSVTRFLLTRSPVSRLHIVTEHGVAILSGFTRLLKLAAVGGWFLVTLDQFRIYRPIYGAVSAVLIYPLTFGKISLTLGGVVMFVITVLVALWISKSIRFILRDEVLPNMSLPRGVANSVASLSYYFLVTIGLSVALVAAGFEIGQLAIVLGALSVGIGLGLQDVVKNFASGLILMFERPIQPGDVIEITGTAGSVRHIGMRATTLATFDGADVVIPNGTMVSEKLTNWTLSNMNRRFEVAFGVAYGTDVTKMLELAMNVTKSTPGVAENPGPSAAFVGMGASSLDFIVRAWTNNFGDWGKTRGELAVRIHDAIVAAGIEIPFPQQDLHIRSIAPDVSASFKALDPGNDTIKG